MTIASMTGFARHEGGTHGRSWVWEIKSVNGKGLDTRCRLPAGFDRIETAVKSAVAGRIKRGSVTVSLALTQDGDASRFAVNRPLLDQLLAVARDYGEQPRIEPLLGVRGVVEEIQPVEDEDSRQRHDGALLTDLGLGLDQLASARAEEGNRLAATLAGQLTEIEGLCARAGTLAATAPEALKARFLQQLDALLGGSPPVVPDRLAPDRLAQEVAVLATKADVREELDRLAAHLDSARDMLAEGGAVGRRLDFLCQEFNREANTLCSKSTDVELTRIGLALKAVIEQFREQVQNIE